MPSILAPIIKESFDFPIYNYPFVDTSNIPPSPEFGVYISHSIATASACDIYEDLIICHIHLYFKLMQQGFAHHKLCKLMMKTLNRHM